MASDLRTGSHNAPPRTQTVGAMELPEASCPHSGQTFIADESE